jgi:hypothetical protein
MKIFFGGAEKGMYASMLAQAQVTRYGINLTHFAIPKKKVLDLKDKFNGGELFLYASENDEDIARYDAFLRAYADDLTYVVGRPDYNGDWLDTKYIPIWNDGDNLDQLNWICQRSGRVAVSDKALAKHTPNRINSIAQRWSANLIGLTSKPDVIENYNWECVLVNSWTSAIRYGETQVWTGHGLRRYPAQQKESARRRHRSDIERLGISYDEVMNDEVDAVGLLAIKSWQSYENRIFGGYEPSTETPDGQEFVNENGDIAIMSPPTPTSQNVASSRGSIAISPLEKRHESERLLLPVLGVESVTSIGSQIQDAEGESIEIAPEKVPVIRYNANPLRQCDNCYLAPKCPSFKEHSDCAFQLPIEIRTKDQLNAALRAMVEMQVGRVMFARFAEELEGQGLDPALSGEVDRVFNLIEKFKNILDTRDLVRFEVEARGSSGVLSRLFGTKVTEVQNTLPGGGLGQTATEAFYKEIINDE